MIFLCYAVDDFTVLVKMINLLLENLKLGSELGSKYHNVQIFLHHNDGHELTDDEVAKNI